MLGEPERRNIELSADKPHALLEHALGPVGAVHFIVRAEAGSVLFARLIKTPADISYELHGPDGTSLQSLQVDAGTDKAYLGRVSETGDYVLRVVSDRIDASFLRAIVAVH
ncbi:hypothetical protein [Tropicimonas marinistellae]|uniref:hypothetical protein n=1 Tax=Tropicimonas marinistellae TaxID=1739787 RepID=UPI0008331CAE|nr:hypothetical protein [Tropicimonas marinistellae]